VGKEVKGQGEKEVALGPHGTILGSRPRHSLRKTKNDSFCSL